MIKYQIKPRFRLVRVETLKAGDRFIPVPFNNKFINGVFYVDSNPSEPSDSMRHHMQARYPDANIEPDDYISVPVRFNGHFKNQTALLLRGTYAWLKIR